MLRCRWYEPILMEPAPPPQVMPGCPNGSPAEQLAFFLSQVRPI